MLHSYFPFWHLASGRQVGLEELYSSMTEKQQAVSAIIRTTH